MTNTIAKITYHVMLGYNETPVDKTPQYAILGSLPEDSERVVAIDINNAFCMTVFGAPGSGKSYVMGTIVESAATTIPGINVLIQPLAIVLFHYSPSEAYKPEFLTMNQHNRVEKEIALLKRYPNAQTAAVRDVIGLAPKDSVERRRAEFPGISYHPLTFRSEELSVLHWQFLMGAVGDESLYLKAINSIIRGIVRGGAVITPALLVQGIDSSYLGAAEKDMARMRCALASEFIDDDGPLLSSYLETGRVIQVDLRDPFLLKSEALSLMIVLQQIFASKKRPGNLPMPKLIAFDECHKYMDNMHLVKGMIELVRERRHQSCNLIFASQDPPSVPIEIHELADITIMLRYNSPLWLKHNQKANANLDDINPYQMTRLKAGEGYIWSAKASNELYTTKGWKIQLRARASQHGGATKSAVMNEQQRDHPAAPARQEPDQAARLKVPTTSNGPPP